MNGQQPVTSLRSTLHAEPVVSTLSRLRAAARDDWKVMLRMTPVFVKTMLAGKSVMKAVPPSRFKTVYMPISPEAGQFLYATARAMGARKVVEFGASFGVSTIYLAAAMKDNGGGSVITTEIEPSKCRAAEQNLKDAGLLPYVDILEGDACQTLANVDGPIELLFLDGWKDLYLPVFELLHPKLRKGAVVIGDNVRFPDARPYVQRVRSAAGDLTSVALFNGGLEFSCLTG
jgi:predicted O-methyltransferase YrrM